MLNYAVFFRRAVIHKIRIYIKFARNFFACVVDRTNRRIFSLPSKRTTLETKIRKRVYVRRTLLMTSMFGYGNVRPTTCVNLTAGATNLVSNSGGVCRGQNSITRITTGAQLPLVRGLFYKDRSWSQWFCLFFKFSQNVLFEKKCQPKIILQNKQIQRVNLHLKIIYKYIICFFRQINFCL